MQRHANNTEALLFTMSFAFVLHGHQAEECNMTSYSIRGESLHILDKLHWCVMETSSLVHNANLYVQLTDEHVNLG